MTARRWMIALTLVAGTQALHAQSRPYYGTWVVNGAKSDLRGVTATYKDIGGNRVEISGMGQKDVWVIGRDGKDYPYVGGLTTSWRDLAPNRWEGTFKSQGKVISRSVATLSPDGASIRLAITNIMPDGRTVETTSTLARVSGGPGPFGTFRIVDFAGGLTVEAEGNAVLFRWTDFAEARCQFDGKECPLKGAVPAGATMTMRELGPRTFEVQDKTNGTVNYTSRFTLADDGKTLSEDQTMATGEKWHIVYERPK